MNHFLVSFVVIVALSAFVQAGKKDDPEVLAAAEKCQASEGATPADMEALQKHSMDLSHEAKCVMACVLKHFQVLSADGKPQKDVYMKYAEAMTKGDATMMKHATEIFDLCQGQTDADICESAFKAGACMKKEMEARKIDIDM